ncbi:dynein intermediate chain 3, ciliary isoform X2 [Zootermopsis nevadensis]|uniref:Dynein intermediate chain 3, ciliary n=1 Tax=Zootermopsis nevadensis TaxID=136037 RepID=A0A067QXI2_ZOONE|nr:dynein intermediate chain 3, ciliary isoform X2 [Zootermopsis nevadensis]KDR14924.1 Dynein intermediate chain 3, ciliary [Zootermopsis nevadensis]
MEIQYAYTKKRSEFGRQCLFVDEGPKLLENVTPNKEELNKYIFKNPVSRSTQCSSVLAEHELNTIRAQYDQHGMNHTEGGWPREVNPADEEQTLRFKKKIEKDEMYIHTVLQLTHAMEHCILQNNAINIYEEYFEGVESATIMERCSARTLNVYRDPNKVNQPVTHLSWSPDGGTRLAVSHCNLEFQRSPRHLSTFSYIWEVENPNKPQLTLKPAVPIVCLEYNPKDPNCLVSGMFSGQVAFWDVRKSSTPAGMSALEPSHRDPVYSVLWINSKSGTEFFSSSTDGQIKWWDTRKLNEPNETLILDVVKGEEQVLSRALGASCLEYEGTIPTRFMVGTENGCVISCNRKGKTAAEKIVSKYTAHVGPVYALQRNPSFLKNFLTIGDWMARIWSEDCKESSIMWTCNHQAQLTDGAWSPTRSSVFFTTRMDGTLDAWDILQEQREAVISVKVCDYQLRSLRVHDQGQLVAVGNNLGTSYLVEFNESLATTQRNDKALLTAMLERESRRERILEARNREIRLRQRTKMAESLHRDISGKETINTPSIILDSAVKNAEKDFFTIIELELAAIQAAAEAHEVEEEYEIKAEALISDKTKKKETIFMVDELKGENSEDEFEGEDMDKDTEGTNES